jgi:hypothetical protein
MNSVYLGSLSDPMMYHAMSLVLSLATSNQMSSLEALKHRGAMLKDVRRRMADSKLVPSISTLSAMLLLIGSEVRAKAHTSLMLHLNACSSVLRDLALIVLRYTLEQCRMFWT